MTMLHDADTEIRDATKKVSKTLLEYGRYDWQPERGALVAQSMMILTALHVLLSALRGLDKLHGGGAAEEFWRVVKDRGDELLAPEGAGGSEVEELRAPGA